MLSTAIRYKDYNTKQQQQISNKAFGVGHVQIHPSRYFESWLTTKNETTLWDKSLEKSTATVRHPQAHSHTITPSVAQNWESVTDNVIRKYSNLWKRLADY